MNPGTLYIKRLPVTCVIGIHPHERKSRQQLLVSVELDLDIGAASGADDVTQTVDYVGVARTINEIAIAGRFQLIETLAERIADNLLTGSVERVCIDVQKPSALANTREVGIRIIRSRTN